jgi:hypothetical protein
MGVLRRARAPLHRLVLHTPARQRAYDRSVVLLRYLGRYTGSYHERAIAVARRGSHLRAVSPRRANGARTAKEWWRNFQPSGPGVLILPDVQLGVVGRVVDGAERPRELAQVLGAYLESLPREARPLGIETATAPDALEEAAPRFVGLVFDLRSRSTSG